MNIKSIAILFAAITGIQAAGTWLYSPGGAAIVPSVGATVRPVDAAAAAAIFITAGEPIPVHFFFSNPEAWKNRPTDFYSTKVTTAARVLALDRFFRVTGSHAAYYRDLKQAEIARMVSLATAGGVWTFLLQHNTMEFLDPAAVSKTTLAEFTVAQGDSIFDPVHPNHIPTSFFNGCSATFLERHANRIMEYLEGTNEAQNLSATALAAVLKVRQAANRLTPVSFVVILADPKKRDKITGDVFRYLTGVFPHDVTPSGRYVPLMRNSVFNKLPNGANLSNSWYKFMSEKQMREFQKDKDIDTTNATELKLDMVGAQAIPGITHKILVSYFKNHVAAGNHGKLGQEHFWKRLDCNGNFKTALKEIDISKIPKDAFRYMTLKQRTAVLAAKSNGGCDKIPDTFLLGKNSQDNKHYRSLKISKKCYEDMKGNEALRFRALAFGLVDSSVAADLDPTDISTFKLATSSKIKGEDAVELDGVLALNILKNAGDRGTSIMKSLMKDEGKAADICVKIEPEKLRHAEWIQGHLSTACVAAIENEFDWKNAKELNEKIWQGFTWKQIKAIVNSSDKKWKGLRDNNWKGLAKNKEFAKKVFAEKEKDEDDKVVMTALFEHLPADKVLDFFNWDFVKHVDNNEALVKYIKSLSPKALSGAGRTYILATFKPDQLTDAQYGQLSDDVSDASAFSSGLGFAETSKLSVDRCAALSPKFVGRMKPVALGAFTAEQLAAIPAESFALVCGEKGKAFSHPLSPEQSEALGNGCETKPVKADDAGASAVESFLALAAAAAGSAAILL